MPTAHPILALSLVSLMASTGCRSSDPLADTWSNDACYGSDSHPDTIESCGIALTFTDALEFSLEAEWVSEPATATYPGCITTKRVTGQTWSTREASDYDVLTLDGESSATLERAGCVNAEDDLDEQATSDISVPEGDISYQVTGDVLSVLSGDLEGVYEL